jgi:nitrite reductase/ring-hydroxylating ferredoxin subunit
MDFIKVASLSELPEGCSKIVRSKQLKSGSVSFQRKITAIGNACLHKGGPLG